ncbi:MAG TPA: epoxyqueuosine reductase [Dehalococcoidia bacterium]|nr:epoxyqueuosine reductase [Dehalococcoidia bacterium]
MGNSIPEILDFTGSLFDVVGIAGHAGYGKLLIVGLESKPERNLDEFGLENNKIKLFGFQKYMSPLLESALSFIRERGYAAEPVGRYGYPLQGQLNLKELAVQAGIGKRGKNSLVLHNKYGPRLRLAAIKIDAPSQSQDEATQKEMESPFCRNCSLCLEACPVSIIEPYRVADISRCLSRIEVMKKDRNGQLIPCDECLKVCPAGKG